MISGIPECHSSIHGNCRVTDPRQSGTWRGRSFIQGGRAILRQALYMPALVAMRFNLDLKQVYDRLIVKGKHGKIAITAIMRKLVVIANAVLKTGVQWRRGGPHFSDRCLSYNPT